MLDLARAQSEMAFDLRPHPNLWHALDKRRPGTAHSFRAAWQALPNARLCEDGDPLPLLFSCNALITDSASFLAEFMLSGRPILRLSRPDSTPLSEFGACLQPGFYDCPDAETLQKHFTNVVLAGQDPLHTIRSGLAASLSPNNATDSAARIRDEILAAIRR
jgi:CDP-glycerol glycerophosphotransferase (TagB/SpsB family)